MMFNQLKKLIKISDKQQARLNRLNQELNAKNEKLHSLSRKLSKYLAPQIYDQLFSGKQDATITSTRKFLTVFFSDIINFTVITEHLQPEAFTVLLNNYFNEMSRIALRYDATIERFLGDSILIFFGDPETRGKKEDALACVFMALEMRRDIKRLNKQWHDMGITESLHIRMGISSGFCTVGNFGSDQRMEYTVMGGKVNLASRLETNAGPDQILIDHETYSLIKDEVRCVRNKPLMVKGIPYPVQTYQVSDRYDRIKPGNELHAERKGFSLSLEPDKLGPEDTAWAQAMLEDALQRIKRTGK
jgi:class 3 adenylate cyclase